MTPDELRSLQEDEAEGLPPLVLALWHDARGEWEAAHHIAQEIDTHEGAWLHAYLHRREGDDANAAYWYRQAHQPIERGSLEREWQHIAQALLGARGRV